MITHGLSKSPEYVVWCSMKKRCENPNTRNFKYYGARGITVCKRWESFENFLADMGPRPSLNHSIERLNNDGNYEPSNCMWIPKSEQNKNRRNKRREGILRARIDINIKDRFDALAETRGISEAEYLRRLVHAEVEKMNP